MALEHPLGFQLYSARNFPPLEDQLRTLAALGYTDVEPFGPLYADAVGAFLVEGQSARLSQAALETLAVIAYRQPVTRGQVSQIRGVNVDTVVKTLSARGLITEVGEQGGAVLFGTTTQFLERLGLASLDELPPLAPFLPDLATIDEAN